MDDYSYYLQGELTDSQRGRDRIAGICAKAGGRLRAALEASDASRHDEAAALVREALELLATVN